MLLQALQPNEGDVEELRGHVVIAGFGRVGQIIAQLLSERLIPFVALDVRSDRVQVCARPHGTSVQPYELTHSCPHSQHVQTVAVIYRRPTSALYRC